MKTIVWANPSAGGGRAARHLEDVRGAFAALNRPVEIQIPQTPEEFQHQVKEAIAANCASLATMGGDGTFRLLARAAHGQTVKLGVIPLGGGNDFASALGIRDWKQAVQVIDRGSCRPVDVTSVRFSTGEEEIYLGGGGAGLDSAAAHLASTKLQNFPGRTRYLAAAILALRKFGGIRIGLKFPGTALPAIAEKVLLVAMLNTPSYGGGVRLASHAKLDDGALEIVLLKTLSALEVIGILPRLFWSGELKTGKIKRIRAKAIELNLPPEIWLHGDGELLGRGSCSIHVIPHALQVYAP